MRPQRRVRPLPPWVSVLAAGLVTMVLSACAGAGTSPEQTAPPASSEPIEPVQVTFLVSLSPNLTEEVWNTFVDMFEQKNPDIDVQLVVAAENVTNTAKQLLASGNLPDVHWNITVSEFARSGALRPFEIDDDVKAIAEHEQHLYSGELYNLSSYLRPHGIMYYNKDLFEDAGITSVPRTWAELDSAAEKLKAAGIPVFLASEVVLPFLSTIYTNEIYGNDPCWNAKRTAKEVSFTDPAILESVERLHRYAASGYFDQGARELDFAEAQQAFIDGEGAMFPSGIWYSATDAAAEGKTFETGGFLMPTKDGSTVMIGSVASDGFTVSATTQQPEAAVRLAKFMAYDPEAQAVYMRANGPFTLVQGVDFDYTPLQAEILEQIEQAEVKTNYATTTGGDCSAVPALSDLWATATKTLYSADGDPLSLRFNDVRRPS